MYICFRYSYITSFHGNVFTFVTPFNCTYARASRGKATTINQIINEHNGFEISVSPALNSQGALSVSNVVKAVDVFVDDSDILSASAAMQAVSVVDDAVAMIGRERAGIGCFSKPFRTCHE